MSCALTLKMISVSSLPTVVSTPHKAMLLPSLLRRFAFIPDVFKGDEESKIL